MEKRLVIIYIYLLLIAATGQVQSQILDRIINRAERKITDRIEDRVSELIADEISRIAMKKIDHYFDELMKERYEKDKASGKTTSGSFANYMSAMDKSSSLPPTYTFDVTLDVKTKSYGKDIQEMQMMFSKGKSIMGFFQNEDNDNTMMVLDYENDIIATYDMKRKTVYAISSSLPTALAKRTIDETTPADITVKKTGKGKNILGYSTEKWEIEDKTTVTTAHVAKDFPVSWEGLYDNFTKKILPTARREKMPSGMVLYSVTKTKKKRKKSTFEVTNIDMTPFIINNQEYKNNMSNEK